MISERRVPATNSQGGLAEIYGVCTTFVHAKTSGSDGDVLESSSPSLKLLDFSIFWVSNSHLGFALQICHRIAWTVWKYVGGGGFFEVR